MGRTKAVCLAEADQDELLGHRYWQEGCTVLLLEIM